MRRNAAKAFLWPIMGRPDLTVLTGVEAQRLTLENDRATGLVVDWQGARRELSARREVIFCAGSIGSPTLLQRSGIGPRELLERLGNSCSPVLVIVEKAAQMILADAASDACP